METQSISIRRNSFVAASIALCITVSICCPPANAGNKGQQRSDAGNGAPSSVVFFLSSQAGEISYESPEYRHGVFTHFVMLGMEGEADRDRDGRVTINELATYVQQSTRQYVERLFRASQHPELAGNVDASTLKTTIAESKQNLPAEVVASGGLQSRTALVIGIDDYLHMEPLNFCSADATALAQRLTQSGFAENKVLAWCNPRGDRSESKRPATKENILKVLDSLSKFATNDEILVLAFSGSGYEIDGQTYLCPADARSGDPDSMISLDVVREKLEHCSAKLKLVLVDACREKVRASVSAR